MLHNCRFLIDDYDKKRISMNLKMISKLNNMIRIKMNEIDWFTKNNNRSYAMILTLAVRGQY
ncbi:hypothetical protein BpHYR1_044229 [Brachionus plicatilis]|uniref:Uncharacterized protein n=1 Tax=Brachionus plicatilis TaxID=10195 RepID=A0A3M7SWD2_BRAPC|nr:hypothetical protein BpHYR1_044229 [Brachionus plicatilis]